MTLGVKHVEVDGSHFITSADRVRYFSNPPSVSIHAEGKPTWTINSGQVYVMNERGSTISTYDLGELKSFELFDASGADIGVYDHETGETDLRTR